MKKKIIVSIIGIVSTIAPVVSDIVSENQKQKQQKIEQEKRYNNQKHNGMVKYASILFSLISIILTITSIKQSSFLLSIIGILAIVAYTITFLYCLEIINEKKQNTYKIVFIIGDMLMVIVATILFF